MKLLCIWASGEIMPFLIMVCDSVEQLDDRLCITKDEIKIDVSDYSFYRVSNLDNKSSQEMVVKMTQSFSEFGGDDK